VSTLKREKPRFSVRFDEFDNFAENCKSPMATRLFAVLARRMKFDMANTVFIEQSAIANRMNTTQPSTSRAISVLVKWKALKKVKGGYMLSPYFIFIGSEEQRVQTIARWNNI